MGYLWNFKIPCKYIEPLVKSLLATTVLAMWVDVQVFNSQFIRIFEIMNGLGVKSATVWL